MTDADSRAPGWRAERRVTPQVTSWARQFCSRLSTVSSVSSVTKPRLTR